METFNAFSAEGVYKTGGPNQALDLKKICEGTAAGVTAAGREKACLIMQFTATAPNLTIKSAKQFVQIDNSGRF